MFNCRTTSHQRQNLYVNVQRVKSPSLCSQLLYLPLPPPPLSFCSSPPTPSSLSGGALNSVPDRPAHRGARLWNGVCSVLSGSLPPRQSTQRIATTEPPEPPGDRPLQSGLCRKAVIDLSPGAHAHRERRDRESGKKAGEAKSV